MKLSKNLQILFIALAITPLLTKAQLGTNIQYLDLVFNTRGIFSLE